MASEEFVSIKDLAKRLNMDRSHARRYVMKLGYEFHQRRTPDSANQRTLCVTGSQAEEILARRNDEGFIASTVVVVSEIGVFYVIQLVPELDPRRVKFGFAESLEQRFQQHRTAAPTAKVLAAWPCKRSWELAAMDALTSIGCRRILNEVFECDELEKMIERANTFFGMFPTPGIQVPLAENSPLRQDSNESKAPHPSRS